MPDRHAHSTLSLRRPDGDAPCYLLVITAESSFRFSLPPRGEVLIGRAPEAGLSIQDASVSRHHARLVIAEGEIQIVDLGSHNGTCVGGERVSGPRALASGDVITIGEIALVFHHAAPRQDRPLLSSAQLRLRLEEEVARCSLSGRPASLLHLHLGPGSAGRDRGTTILSALLRPIDLLARGTGTDLLVLLPEVADPSDDTEELAQRMLRELATAAPQARAGIASCPEDGGDADALLGAASAAAAAAQAGEVRAASRLPATLSVGDLRIVVADPAMSRIYGLLEKLSRSELPVLIYGETGTGKELAAAALHHGSSRSKGALISVNCGAIPESLLESELFGYEKGGHSTATTSKRGLLESGNGGTVFLDEVGEMPQAAQVKLLRVLESRRFTRLGDTRERELDVRLVAATNRDLEAEVKAGRFRLDLFYRLAAAQVVLPPLRDRPRELPLLARHFLEEACARAGRPPITISAVAMCRLLRHGWPGNVRELRNAMDYVAATTQDAVLMPWHLPGYLDEPSAAEEASTAPEEAEAPVDPSVSRIFRPIEEELRDMERTRMIEALAASGGHHRRASELIRMPKRTWAAKFKLYRISEAGKVPG